MCEAMLRGKAVAQMPFAAESADVAMGGQDIGVAGLAFEIFLGIRRNAALGNPVVNAVLRRNAASHEAGPCRRADGRGTEEVAETHALGCQAVEVGRAD